MWGWQHAEYHFLRENSDYISVLGVESKHCPWLSCTHQGRGSSELLSLISLNPDSHSDSQKIASYVQLTNNKSNAGKNVPDLLLAIFL